MFADLHLKTALEDKVKLLACVFLKLNGLVLLFGRILVTNPIWLGYLISKLRSKVLDVDTFLFCGLLTFSLTGYGVGGKSCSVTFEQINKFNIKCQRTLVDKCKRHIKLCALVKSVLFESYLSFCGHLFLGPAHNLTHLLNSGGDLLKLCK